MMKLTSFQYQILEKVQKGTDVKNNSTTLVEATFCLVRVFLSAPALRIIPPVYFDGQVFCITDNLNDARPNFTFPDKIFIL